MPRYIKSNLLSIGGLEFRFSHTVSWPDGGSLACYNSFLDRSAIPVAESDVINVAMKIGLPPADTVMDGLMESGDGIRWFNAGAVHVVEKVLPHISSGPLWRIEIRLEDKSAELYFSELYIEKEEIHDGWPVGAPRYPMDQHMAMHFLASRNGALIHSAGIGLNGRGFMCSGVSGAGKTTTSRLLIEDGRFEVLTDDRVIVRCKGDGGVTMHGTPWTGEGQYATSGTAPLAAIFFLKQDKDVRARRLSEKETVERFLPVTSIPWFSEDLMTQTLKTLEDVAKNTPAYDLHFTKTSDTASLIADMI